MERFHYDNHSNSLGEQITNHPLRNAILSGVIAEGARLLGSTSLAGIFGLLGLGFLGQFAYREVTRPRQAIA